MNTEKYKAMMHNDADSRWNKENVSSKPVILSKTKDLLNQANYVSKTVHYKEVKSVKKLADDEFYIEVFERAFHEIDFKDLKEASDPQMKAENLQIMIDFLGSAVYEMDLSHIEPQEILRGNLEHIQRFVKLLYEWASTQTGSSSYRARKKIIDMGASGSLPTADTCGNMNSLSSKNKAADFYKQARPELKVDLAPQATSKFRILSPDEN
jgi:hypothetical protein